MEGALKKEGTHVLLKVKAKNGEGASIKWTHAKMVKAHSNMVKALQ